MPEFFYFPMTSFKCQWITSKWRFNIRKNFTVVLNDPDLSKSHKNPVNSWWHRWWPVLVFQWNVPVFVETLKFKICLLLRILLIQFTYSWKRTSYEQLRRWAFQQRNKSICCKIFRCSIHETAPLKIDVQNFAINCSIAVQYFEFDLKKFFFTIWQLKFF